MKPSKNLDKRAATWVVAAVVSGLLAFSGNYLPDQLIPVAFIGLVIFLPSTFVASYYLKRAGLDSRRRTAKEAPPPESPPVLYLRSFEDDATASAFRGDLTEEENLVRALAHIGPVVAIGKPGEELPLAGASRLYVTDDCWQERVVELVGLARLVVIRTGLSPGLMWELQTVLKLSEPSRVLLAADDAKEITRLISEVQAVHASPPFRLPFRRKKLGSLLGFVLFESHWQPVFLPVKRAAAYLLAREEHNSLMYAAFMQTLRPVFDQLEIRVPRPRLDILKIGFWLFCIALLGWAIIFASEA
jgi:hypothetical protein